MTIDDPVAARPGTCPVNLWSLDFSAHFWDRIGELQSSGQLGAHRQGETTCYFVTGFDDVTNVLRDYKTFSSESGVAILGGDNRSEPPKNEGRFLPEDLDPPRLTEWRRLVNPFLTLEQASTYRPRIVATIDELLEQRLPTGRFRVMEDFLRPLQFLIVLSEILHLEGRQVEEWMDWSHDLFVGATPEIAVAAFININRAAEELVRERMAAPLENDVVSAVSNVAQIDGREPTIAERTAVVVPLAIAGTESVGTVLGGMIHHLATNPDDLAELEADLDLIPAAVEEGLRMFANVTALQRTVTSSTKVADVPLSPGDKVWTSYNGANRDARQFPDPHRWNLHRDEMRHVAFSVGPHRCIGAHHARVMMEATLRRLVELIPRFELPDDQHIDYFSMPTRGIHEFEIVFPTQQEGS
jgi:cytochrome P450